MVNNISVLQSIIRRKMIKESKPIQFKIRPSNRRYYYKVFIWSSRPDMLAGAALANPDFQACFVPFMDEDDPPCIGELHFNRGYLSPGVVVHELLHSIFDLAYRQGQKIKPPSPIEPYSTKDNKYCEFLCGEIEGLMNQFCKNYPLTN